MAKVRNYHFRARKLPNLRKLGVAKHNVGGAKAVDGAKLVGQPPHQLYRKLRPWTRQGVLFHWWAFSSKRNDTLQLF